MLKEKISKLPKSFGCYLFRNKTGKVIYVGKAKDLRKRVSSYLRPQGAYLMSKVTDMDFIMTESEADALILENNLIKKYQPKYNIRLRDDKSYPYIGLNMDHPFPRLLFLRHRGKRKKGLKLFGPFPHGSGISHVLRILNKIYQLRDCTDRELKGRETPCLLYQLKQCSAPCVNLISSSDYLDNLKKVEFFLQGKQEGGKILEEVEREMFIASEKEEFERAAILRDSHAELGRFFSDYTRQNVQRGIDKNIDLISYFEGEDEVDLCFYFIRAGQLRGEESFYFEKDKTLDEVEEQILSFIYQYYQERQDLPHRLVGNFSPESFKLLKESLGESVFIISPENISYKGLLQKMEDHARNNAEQREGKRETYKKGLLQLQKILSLKTRPVDIECYDIAVWQGKSPTASLVFFHEGKPEKSRYRHYHLKERPEGNNDFAMMEEVFERRVKRGSLPDVFLLDGGKGQIKAVRKVLAKFNISTPIMGIAKSRILSDELRFRREAQYSEERLVLENRKNAIDLKRYPELFKILTFMRDEAHRFSRKLHHKAEKKRFFGE